MTVDLHSHLLPYLDDGSKSIEESIALAKQAIENGIDVAVMTPHHMDGVYVNHKKNIIAVTKKIQQELSNHKVPLSILPSQEIRINPDILSAIKKDDILFADKKNRYLLIEFPFDDVPTYTNELFFQLAQRNITVQIAHPERNARFLASPDILLSLVKIGAVVQLTADSYTGKFGKKIEKFSSNLLKHNLVHTIVSDAHHLNNRNFEIKTAYKKVEKKFGKNIENLLKTNAQNIVNGDDVVRYNEQSFSKKKFFFF